MVTLTQLQKIMPFAGRRALLYYRPLTDAMEEFSINTPAREAAFLAQIAHESGSLRYTREIASGAAYEGRGDLGNTEPGDGIRFKGRGLIQITGRSNYKRVSKALYGDLRLLKQPEMLEEVIAACRSAAWFWADKELNTLADEQEFRKITRAINGGYNGQIERFEIYKVACQTLGVEMVA